MLANDEGQDLRVLRQKLEEWLQSEEGSTAFLEALQSGNEIVQRFQKAKDIDKDVLDFQMNF